MSWTILLLSGVLEAVWATAIAASDGFRRIVPTIVFLTAGGLSMAGLAYAMQEISVGTAYAVWVGVGAVLTVLVAVCRGEERLTAVRTALLAGLIVCVIGLKAVA
ncbi:ligand-binding protein SH3 [Aeromicrobium sp. Root344]|uniref:DMT family transporter n=1 Tax=Aeromicrobium sp. Root344 TaxID=1736521 RepID=UPI0006F4662A|nr:multidrug efflux SMR transporter [Aeromicrobium sp. Root344]KQV75366.1 ligand-binding protein SH3 [Aeromicrobium sp. Root344]